MEAQFFQEVKSKCCRGRFPYLNKNRNSDTIDLIYGYIEEWVLHNQFLQNYPVEKDDENCPIWAV